MPRQTWLLVIIGAVVVAAAGLGYYFSIPHPTHLSGDPWDYTILTAEVPKDWRLVSQGVITPHDVQQESLESNLPISNSLSLKNLVQLYYGKYEPPEQSEYLNFDIEIITYNTDVGDQARVWGGLLTSQQNDTQVTIAVHEIDFQVGRYVGSIRLQSRPLAESEYVSAQLANLQTALKFAQAMVINLRAVQK
jgi:hypothetical protein